MSKIFMPKKIKSKIKKLVAKKAVAKVVKEKPIGHVTHYFGNLGVAIIKFKKTVNISDQIRIKGATTDFKQKISSMQYDHKDITTAKPKMEVGVKVKKRVREGDMVYGTNI